MSRTLTVSTGAVTPMLRRDAAGRLAMVEPEGGEYATPLRGSRGRLELSGISEVFEMTSQFKPDPVEKIRVEYRMAKGANASARQVEGMRFTEIMTWTMGPKSSLGRLVGALRGAPVQPGERIDPDDYIGTTFVCTTTTSDDGKWGRVNPDAIEAGSVRLPAGVAAPAAPGDGDAGEDGGEEEDPFADEV